MFHAFNIFAHNPVFIFASRKNMHGEETPVFTKTLKGTMIVKKQKDINLVERNAAGRHARRKIMSKTIVLLY